MCDKVIAAIWLAGLLLMLPLWLSELDAKWPKAEGANTIVSVAAAMFWPVVLPVLVVVWLTNCLIGKQSV